MGIYVALTMPDGNKWVTRETVHAYCDHVVAKERRRRPDAPKEELVGNRNRNIWITQLERDDRNRALISHRLYSRMTGSDGVDLRVSEDDNSSVLDYEPIFGDDVELALRRFREGKARLAERDDDTNWEQTLELQHIALCEFALEHDHGLVYS